MLISGKSQIFFRYARYLTNPYEALQVLANMIQCDKDYKGVSKFLQRACCSKRATQQGLPDTLVILIALDHVSSDLAEIHERIRASPQQSYGLRSSPLINSNSL
jgi:hypothetical protein